jgi:2-oxoisovalerate dehydrogenase E1 component
VYEVAPALIEALRRGDGPVLIEAKVVRIDPHSSSDDHRKYRSDDDIRRALERDPLLQMEARLLEQGTLTTDEMA